MQRFTIFVGALAGLAGLVSPVAAQTGGGGGPLLGAAPRPEVQLSTGLVTTSTNSFGSWHIASPKQPNTPDPANGIIDSRRVVYATWDDINRNREIVTKFARSVDGGWSWPVQTTDVFATDPAAGESFERPDCKLVTFEDTVGFVLTSNIRPNGSVHPNNHDYVWLCASADQGQTWQTLCVNKDAALSSGDILGDCDQPWVAIDANGVFHVVFEADYGNPDPSNSRPGFAVGANDASIWEDSYYIRASFDSSGTLALIDAEERLVEVGTPTGTIDTDTCRVFTAGTRFTEGTSDDVLLVYRDNREELSQTGAWTNAGSWNGTYSRVSNDGGATFGNEVLHNPSGTLPTAFGTRVSKGIVGGSTMIVTMEDSRPVGGSSLDRIWGSISFDRGQTWTTGLLLSDEPDDPATSTPVDIDNHHIAHAGDTFVLSYCHDYGDNGGGVGNTDNDVYVVVDSNGGQDWAQGNVPSEQLVIDTATNCSVFRSNVDMIFDADGLDGSGSPAVIALSAETSGFPEDSGYAFSVDGGQSWQWYETLQFQSGDTDDIFVAVSLNGDVNTIWQDDDNRGNGNNNVYTRGGKILEGLVEGSGPSSTLLSRFPPTSELASGDLCLFVPSLTAPVSNAGAFPYRGQNYITNFSFDAASLAAISNAGLFVAFYDANGEARAGLPNLAAVLGQPIHWMAVPFATAMNGGPDNAVRLASDPFVQNP